MAERPHLGILASHPIQYHAPLFRALASREEMDLTVFFSHRPTAEEQGAGFGVPFEWDVDLTSGYRHEWLRNVAVRPSVTQFSGCDTPGIGAALDRSGVSALLVMGWHSRSYVQGMLAARRRRLPVMVRGDSILSTERGLAKRLAKRVLYPPFLRSLSACLAVGARSEEYFRHYGARRVFRVPHFVENEVLRRRAHELRSGPGRLEARRAWGLKPDVPVFLFAGKFIPEKRIDTFVEALALAATATGPGRAAALFAGDGALRPSVERLARDLEVDAAFTGFLNQREMPLAYAAADALILPSESETWGMVVNEAMASGLPAFVSANVGCAPDLIVEGQTGATFPSGDPSALADILAAYAAAPERLAASGEAAERHVQRFSSTVAADGVVEAVRWVTSGGKGSR